MKTHTLLALLILSLILILSCSDDEKEKIETKSTYLITDDHINIPLNIIDSLDLGTGRLFLAHNISPDSISDIVDGDRKFMINGKFYFNLYYTNSLNSSIVNNPVIFYNFKDSKLYIHKGYPPLDSLENDVQKLKEIRERNWNIIRDPWLNLIEMLESNDITIVDSRDLPFHEPEYPNSGDSIVLSKANIKSFDMESGRIELYEEIPFEYISTLWPQIYKLCIDSISFFDVYYTSTSNSMIINRPVLLYNVHEGDLYFKDGYPMVEVLGDAKYITQKLRDKNMKLIEKEWTDFLNYIAK